MEVLMYNVHDSTVMTLIVLKVSQVRNLSQYIQCFEDCMERDEL